MTNTLIELNGDEAGAETYWTLTLRVPREGRIYDIMAGGRYLDRFERIGRVWAIRHRQSIVDWDRVEPVTMSLADFADDPLIAINNPEALPPVPSRDRNDPSYSVVGWL